MNAGLWFAGWAIVLAMLWGMSKFGVTRIILYWLLWLSIIWMLIAYSDELSSLVQSALGNSGVSTTNSSPSPLPTNTTNSTSQTSKQPNTNKTITK